MMTPQQRSSAIRLVISIFAFADAEVADRVQRARRLGLATGRERLVGGGGLGVETADRIPLPRTPARERAPVLAAVDLADALLVGLRHLALAGERERRDDAIR